MTNLPKPTVSQNPLFQINLRGNLLSLHGPLVMGILNVTPDSFYDGGNYTKPESILKKAEQMLQDGATLIDVGGYSSRPNASHISTDEELRRVIPALERLTQYFPEAYFSIDTFRAKVAQEALTAGAVLVNDISGGTLDKEMFNTVARWQVPYILMHMQGTPQTMKTQTHYEDILREMLHFFIEKVQDLHTLSVKDIIIDLGFGFAKNMTQNYQLLASMRTFEILQKPMLIGISRKSMIYKALELPSAQHALNGSTVLHTYALLQGANILRVHDVQEAMQAIRLVKLLKEAEPLY